MSRPRLAAFAFLLTFAPGALAQLPPNSDTTSAPIPGAGHDYLHGPHETVNPANGSLSIIIPVIIPPARGVTLPFSFTYASNGSHYLAQPPSNPGLNSNWYSSASVISQLGWSNTVPAIGASRINWKTTNDAGQKIISCSAITNYVYQDVNGGRHNMGLTTYSDPNGTGPCTYNSNDWPKSFDGLIVTLGGEGSILATMPPGWGSSNPVTVTDADGTSYYFPAHGVTGGFPGGSTSTWVAATVTDRNGNTLNTSGVTPAVNYTDTLGRTVLQDSGFAVSPETVTVSGLPAPYTLRWSPLSIPSFSAQVTQLTPQQPCGTPGHAEWGTSENQAVSSITLPNGQSFTLAYDTVYGNVNKIIYPTGGYIRYVWGMNANAEYATYSSTNGQTVYTCSMYYGTPAVTDRYVSFDGVHEVEWQHFNYATNWDTTYNFIWDTKVTTVTTHDLVRNTSSQTQYTYSSVPAEVVPNMSTGLPQQVPVEQSIIYYDTTGSTLETVSKSWINERLLKTQETAFPAPNNEIDETSWSYDVNEMETERDDYDYGSGAPGSLLRKTVTSYAYSNNPTLSANHVIDKPSSVIVYDGSSNRVGETDYTYDVPAAVTTSGIVEHGSACFCGNLTVQAHWLNASGAALTTNYTNDNTGQRLSTIDPRGNTTTYSYADNYSSGTPAGPTNAYLTQITRPVTNGVNHITKFTYALASGEVTTSTDENNLVTTYLYGTKPANCSFVDYLSRLTETDYPDGGSSTNCYNDSPYSATAPSPSVTTTKKINPSTSLITVAAFDGLYHPVRSEITSDPQGTGYTDTAYDGLGRAYTVSNPYRSGTDPTTSAGTTTYIYDGLGRKCVEVPADGTAVTGNTCPTSAPAKDLFTVYSANVTTVTDQTGRKRQSTTDGLGRLTQVVEDPGGLGYITNYTIDALGNLKQVVQDGSHTRTFAYDFLSRLLTSTNPEVGTITYNYDADSNCASPNSFLGLLVSKVDGRGIRTCERYDALNRETLRTYSNGDLSVTTNYDEPNCLGLSACQNIGHATSMIDAAGSETWAYQVDAANQRSVHVNKRTTISAPNNITETFTYQFDLAGNLSSITYPTTGRVVTYTYDAANRPQTAVDSSNGITYAAAQATPPSGCSSAGVCYTPQGTEYSAAIGKTSTFSGINLSETYNTRLQPLELKAYSSAGSAFDITYNFADHVTGGNAGHVNAITNNLNTNRSQSFNYDSLSRIINAGTTATSGTYCWGYQYDYDAWANLKDQLGWSPTYNGCSEATMATVAIDGNNHITTGGFTYDLSGNTTNDGSIPYIYNGENQIKTAAGVTYSYDGSGRRVSKSSGKLYWYGSGGEILAETNASGTTLNEYVFFGGKRVALLPAGGNAEFYAEDFLGTSRVMTQNNGALCYDADFDPYGGEHAYTNNCPSSNAYKFEGKERDTETGNDDFGARYYTERFGRWLSADWSSVPAPVPYANLSNPQTLNLYAMVSDDPESFADLDGHDGVMDTIFRLAGGSLSNPGPAMRNLVVGAAKTIANLAISANNEVRSDVYGSVGGISKTPELPLNNEGEVIGGQAVTTLLSSAVGGAMGEAMGAAEDASLASRAQEIHGALDPIAQNMRTTAVGDVTDASGARQTLVSSSERTLSPAQRAALKPGETPISGPKGTHAEQKIMDHAQANGQTVNGIAPSRNACPTCAANAADKKIPIQNPSSQQ